MRIGINCGHTVSGTVGCGAVGYIDESIEARKVGYALEDLLKKAGHTVRDCTNDYAPTVSSNLRQIVDMANSQPLDLFVSIHFNSGGGQGTEVWTYGGKKFDEATNTCKAISELGFKNRGIKDGSKLYVVHHSDAKAMLVEVCFVDTEDANKYKKIGATEFAKAIFKGITGQVTKDKTNKEELNMTQYEELLSKINELDKKKADKSEMIYDCIDSNMPEWAHKPVQWCLDNGIVSGADDAHLNLNNTKLWVCVVVYVKDKGITNPIYIKAYLNITNPIYIDKDFLNWNADQVVTDLDKQGIISSEDGLKILNIADLELKNSKLREILKNKGYDGIVYNNEIEAISFLMTNKFLGRTQIQIK